MPRYFLDTSAVAKLYRSEAGSAFVDRIFSEPASQHVISRLAIVEMESVFALKARTGEIEQQAVLIARRRLEADLGRSRLLVAAVNDDHFRDARRLLIKHGTNEALRTLDALQLAIALGLKRAGLATVFIAADQKLCRVAALEGFEVTNPEQPPAVVI
ncbi:MAG TPA: type II toxin-antitoxin system VapC family toxin [Bryobacteraceae bacterium]|nr:type II toxin-antitoxin system VapC family toxin [Bryobacteraceae bacterium]